MKDCDLETRLPRVCFRKLSGASLERRVGWSRARVGEMSQVCEGLPVSSQRDKTLF